MKEFRAQKETCICVRAAKSRIIFRPWDKTKAWIAKEQLHQTEVKTCTGSRQNKCRVWCRERDAIISSSGCWKLGRTSRQNERAISRAWIRAASTGTEVYAQRNNDRGWAKLWQRRMSQLLIILLTTIMITSPCYSCKIFLYPMHTCGAGRSRDCFNNNISILQNSFPKFAFP